MRKCVIVEATILLHSYVMNSLILKTLYTTTLHYTKHKLLSTEMIYITNSDYDDDDVSS